MSPPAPFDPAWGFFTCDLELTNRCAIGCAFCPRDAIRRPVGAMDEALFRTVADALIAARAEITLSGMGDPLAHPAWASLLRCARARGAWIGIQVSAASLDPGAIAALVAARPSFIHLSIPSIRPEVLARILPHRDPEQVMAEGLRLIEACRGRARATVIGVRTALEPEEAEEEFLGFWKARGVPARISPCHSRGGNLRDGGAFACAAAGGPPSPCGLFARHAFITWQGDLLACCHDLAGETRIGNLGREGLAELAARKALLAPLAPAFDLCRRCDEPLRRLPLPSGIPPAGRRARARHLRAIEGSWFRRHRGG